MGPHGWGGGASFPPLFNTSLETQWGCFRILKSAEAGNKTRAECLTSPQDAGRGGKASNKVYNQHTHTGDLG